MNAVEPKPLTFFQGVHLLPRVIGGVGACLFLASFFVKGFEGLGRALGLFGICLIFCAVVVNLIEEILSGETDAHLRRHLVLQSLLASAVAIAVLCLGVYVYQHGTLPKFMPTRYGKSR